MITIIKNGTPRHTADMQHLNRQCLERHTTVNHPSNCLQNEINGNYQFNIEKKTIIEIITVHKETVLHFETFFPESKKTVLDVNQMNRLS